MSTKETIKTSDLLLEIWVEELPARYAESAVAQLKELAQKSLQERKLLGPSEIQTYGTPNRLILFCSDINLTTPKETKIVFGPLEKMLKNPDGSFTVQAIGFAKKYGVSPDKIAVVEGKASLNITTGGESARTILAQVLPELISKLEFPKTMVWEETKFRFARPLRNLVALLGKDVIRFSLAGVKSSNKTYGLHVYSDKKISVISAKSYFEKIKNTCVIADPQERIKIMHKVAEQALKIKKARILDDEPLMQEVCFLVENPVAVLGSFDEDFLQLPKEALLGCMKDKQRFFPVVDSNGNLMHMFLGFRNGRSEFQDIVREGYERVLRARLADVRFFFEKDKSVKLQDKVQKLRGIIQNEQLGSVYEKTERLKKLVNVIADKLSFSQEEKQILSRSAELSKADLVTEMVFEYPELQGKMGGVYARIDGEDSGVADAVYEQYLPNLVNDPLPASKIGAALAFADKIDSLMSSFILGYVPKGSGDPYGLRRMALGILRIIFEIKYELPLDYIVNTAFTYFPEELQKKNPNANRNLLEFIRQRLSVYFQTNGFSYDTIDAVLSSKEWPANLMNTKMKAENLQQIRSDKNFEPFVLLYRRAANILKQAKEKNIVFEGKFYDSKLVQKEEQDLGSKCIDFDKDYESLLAQKKYNELFFQLLGFKELLGSFFDKVLVMTDDETLKFNRLALIQKFSQYFEPLADFSKIVLKDETIR